MTYDQRLQTFHGPVEPRDRANGFISWYGATGSYVEEVDEYTGETRSHLHAVGCRLPARLTFEPWRVGEYFQAGEDLPCFMPGSIRALRFKDRKWSRHTYEVFQRQVKWWFRKAKITCLSSKEWLGIVYEGFWLKRLQRLSERYGDKCDGMEWLRDLVTVGAPSEKWWRARVLVNGVLVEPSDEQLSALRELHAIERKLRRIA